MFNLTTSVVCIIIIVFIQALLNSVEKIRINKDKNLIKILYSSKYLLAYTITNTFFIIFIVSIFIYFGLNSLWYTILVLVIGASAFFLILKRIIILLQSGSVFLIDLKKEIIICNKKEIPIYQVKEIVLEKRIGESWDDSNRYSLNISYSNNHLCKVKEFDSMQEMIEIFDILNTYLNVEGKVIIKRGFLDDKIKSIEEYR